MNRLREKVSLKKKRFVQDSFNLDLSYITDNLIAMGFPSEGMEGVYRNQLSEIKRFLEFYHENNYMVYNLCSERVYLPSKFDGQGIRLFFNPQYGILNPFKVRCFPFPDHNPPPLCLIHEFCESVDWWLKQREDHIAAVHCKAGKGRTGVLLCCYLLHSKAAKDTEGALKIFADARTNDGKGVTIPSQRRYIRYYQQSLKAPGHILPTPDLYIKRVHMSNIPAFLKVAMLKVKCKNKKFITRMQPANADARRIAFNLSKPIHVRDDVKLFLLGKDKAELFTLWFNTAFVEDLILVFEKSDLDKSQSGKDKLKSFDDKMKLYISFMDEKQFRIHSEHSAEQDGSVSNDEVSLDEVKSESEEDSTIKRKRKKKDGDEEGSEKKKDRKRKAVEEDGSRKSPRKGSVGSRLRPRTATDSPRTPKKHSEVKAKSGEKRSKSQTELKGHKRNMTTSEDRDSSDKDQNNNHEEEDEEEDEEAQVSKEKEKAAKEQEEKKKKRKKSGSQLGRSETASNSPRKEKISHPSKNLRMRSHSQKELKQKKTTPISPKEDRQTNNNHHHEASEDGSEGSSGSQRTPKLKKRNRSLSDALLKKNNEQDEIKVATTARKEKERSKPRKAKSLSSAGPLSPRGVSKGRDKKEDSDKKDKEDSGKKKSHKRTLTGERDKDKDKDKRDKKK